MDFLASLKSKYLSDFPPRRDFRHIGTDVNILVVVPATDLSDVSIDGKRDFRPYVFTITLLLPENHIK